MSGRVSRPRAVGSDTLDSGVLHGMSSTRRISTAVTTGLVAAGLLLSACSPTTAGTATSPETASVTTPKAPVPTITAQPAPTPSVAQETIKALVKRALHDVDDFWETALGRTISAEVVPFDSRLGERPTCDGNTTNVASYCSATTKEDTILWDVSEMSRIRSEGGDLAVALVMAHEYGHAVLDDMGQNPIGVTAENRADCLSGAYLAHAEGDYTGDWNTAVNAAKPEGAEAPDQRAARIAGINAGRAMADPAACLSYSP